MAKKKIMYKYKCTKCNVVWEEDDGIGLACPNCKSLYIKWINYEKFRRLHGRKSVAYGADY